MNDILSSVDERTQLAGNNRMELLTFNLAGSQKYGINVFKVREVMLCPLISEISDSYVKGIVHLRGTTFSVIDLNKVVHETPLPMDSTYLIVAEFNQTLQGFIVRGVDRILNLAWDEIHPPPDNISTENFVTATTYQNSELIQVLDVEKVLDKIAPNENKMDTKLIDTGRKYTDKREYEVVICDDSSVARRNLQEAIEKVGCLPVIFENGLEAYLHLKERKNDRERMDSLLMLISDIEMPEMDGFTLLSKIRKEAEFIKTPMYMHSSLSGDVNEIKAKEMGATGFLNKFDANQIAKVLNEAMENKEKERKNTNKAVQLQDRPI
ncbi:MAG: chemotaxis protein [Pseudomonadales bacterium]|nr:chemotaxis protein [Pseudomonadales bacterium]